MPYKDLEKRREYHRLYMRARYQRDPVASAKKVRDARRANPEKAREQVRVWRVANPEKWAECNRRWHKENKGKIQIWRNANKEKLKSQRRIQYAKNPEKEISKSLKWQADNPERFWAINTLSCHRCRGYGITMTIDELMGKIKETKECRYCGIPLEFKRNGTGLKRNSPSLDRINNGKIINKDTIQIICHSCNTSKSNRTHQEFIQYCGNIYKRLSEVVHES